MPCPVSVWSGEILSTSEALAVITFGENVKGKMCTTAGLPVNSLGDAAGVILMHVEIRECLSSASTLELKLLPVHLEVPSTKLLLVMEGTALGTVTSGVKQSTFALTVSQSGGKNSIETCGKEKLILETSTDGGAFVQTGAEFLSASLTFGAPQEFM